MTLFIARDPARAGTPEQLREDLQERAPAGARLHSSYWTPRDQELLSIYSGESDARPAREMLPVLPVTSEEYGPPAMRPAAAAVDLGLVLVRRRLDPLTHSEFRAIALQAIMCAYEYSDMRWLRSYWSRDTDQLFCLFETRTHELVREHARRSRIPCDEVLDAIEIVAPDPPSA